MAHKELYDVGENRQDPSEPVTAPGSKKIYPGFQINDTLLPMLKEAINGQEFKFEGILRVTGTREPEDFDTIQTGDYVSIDILKMGEPGSIQKSET